MRLSENIVVSVGGQECRTRDQKIATAGLPVRWPSSGTGGAIPFLVDFGCGLSCARRAATNDADLGGWQTLEAGSAVVEAVGNHPNVDMGAWWKPDDILFDLLRDKELLIPYSPMSPANISRTPIAEKVKTSRRSSATSCRARTVARKATTGCRAGEFPAENHTKRCGFRTADNGPTPGRCLPPNESDMPRRFVDSRGFAPIRGALAARSAPLDPASGSKSGRQSSPLPARDCHAEMPAGAPGARAH
uniref:Probable partitioning protein n=1 Tax=Rhizobium loti TaxID=381 RepID=M5AM66_RHILI|nr:probable partitioning protein [Mesorhizobium loti NZP2037]